jgi:profilin
MCVFAQVGPAEASTLIGAFSDPAVLISGGVHASGVKYMYLRSDDRSIYGKKGSDGIVIVKTNQTLLIGVYGAPATPGNATVVVEK